ncbi:hypothetical protein [Undibacterium sp. KW1]|uniref:hypothetical protein n=1 Tax=Undibacterium sp. KW1 TaxID=2058624 RepID=UPI00138A5647|nr:hypothetical protein [Undibacterium sp. KW1]
MKNSLLILSCPACGEAACSASHKTLTTLCDLPVRCKNCHRSLTCHWHIALVLGTLTGNSWFGAAIFWILSYKTFALTLLTLPVAIALPLVLRARFYERKKRRFFRSEWK